MSPSVSNHWKSVCLSSRKSSSSLLALFNSLDVSFLFWSVFSFVCILLVHHHQVSNNKWRRRWWWRQQQQQHTTSTDHKTWPIGGETHFGHQKKRKKKRKVHVRSRLASPRMTVSSPHTHTNTDIVVIQFFPPQQRAIVHHQHHHHRRHHRRNNFLCLSVCVCVCLLFFDIHHHRHKHQFTLNTGNRVSHHHHQLIGPRQ